MDGAYFVFFSPIKQCLFLGGKSIDVATEIKLLHLNHNNTIHTFYHCVQEIQTKLQYSRENDDKTRLLKLYL